MTPILAAEPVVPTSREQVQLTFAPVVKKAAPAVVNIYTRKVIQNRIPFGDDPIMRQFFGNAFPKERVQNSLGSGVIVRSSGIIVTNNHVAADADQITVVLNDRREFEAKVVGKDERSDLAVLQLQNVTDPLPALTLANSDEVEVGDLVLAIGNPYGVGQTVTSGIISGLARSSVDVGVFRSFIQTDAAINPGNSGGALITSDGRLIGINTAIYSQSGGNVGIGFATPANMVQAVVSSILKEGRAVRPWMGATGKSITSDVAKSLALSAPSGVLIDRVIAGSPADTAGLAVGDVIRSVNGRAVHDVDEFRYLLATLPVSGKATLGTIRKGAERVASMPLLPPPDLPARKKTALAGRQPFSGATVATFNPAVADELGREYLEPGVVVLEVRPGTIAANLGIQPGDMILTLGDSKVTGVDQFQQLLAGPGPWLIGLGRNGQTYQMRVPG